VKIKNDARCRKCGDEIESKSRHDFVTCKCGAISVDGGQDYMRRCGNPEDFLPVLKRISSQKVEGWDSWGNEVESDIEIAKQKEGE